ncbi:MAG: hypothetical protein KAG61_01925 [Bacteriovoracaceae bacterium]|nr:hypothetical protein [Bacteriovoracaceae bacterium]
MEKMNIIITIFLTLIGFTSLADEIDCTNSIESSPTTDNSPGANRVVDWKQVSSK